MLLPRPELGSLLQASHPLAQGTYCLCKSSGSQGLLLRSFVGSEKGLTLRGTERGEAAWSCSLEPTSPSQIRFWVYSSPGWPLIPQKWSLSLLSESIL